MAQLYWVLDGPGAVRPQPLDKNQVQDLLASGYADLICPDGGAWQSAEALGISPAAPTAEESPTPDPSVTPAFFICDTETGGLNPVVNPLLSVACIVSPATGEELDGFALLVRPPEGTLLEVPVPSDMWPSFRYKKREVAYYQDVHTQERFAACGDRPVITAIAAETNGYVGGEDTGAWDLTAAARWNECGLSAGKVDEVLVRFLLQFFDSKPIAVAHNAQFDYKFVSRYLPSLKQNLRDEWFCTYKALRSLRKKRGLNVGKGMCTLDAMCKYAGYTNPDAHEALADARACSQGLQWLIGEAKEAGLSLRSLFGLDP